MTALKESVFNHHIFCLSSYSFLWIPKVSYTVLEFTVFSFLCVWPDFCYKYLLSTYILNPILTKTLSSEYIVFLLRQINSSKNNTKNWCQSWESNPKSMWHKKDTLIYYAIKISQSIPYVCIFSIYNCSIYFSMEVLMSPCICLSDIYFIFNKCFKIHILQCCQGNNNGYSQSPHSVIFL